MDARHGLREFKERGRLIAQKFLNQAYRLAQQALYSVGGCVPDKHSDDLGRVAEANASVAEVRVLGDDHIVIVASLFPNRRVGSGFKTEGRYVGSTRKEVAQSLGKHGREVLVEKELGSHMDGYSKPCRRVKPNGSSRAARDQPRTR